MHYSPVTIAIAPVGHTLGSFRLLLISPALVGRISASLAQLLALPVPAVVIMPMSHASKCWAFTRYTLFSRKETKRTLRRSPNDTIRSLALFYCRIS